MALRKNFAVVVMVAVVSLLAAAAVSVSAQDLGDFAPSSSPSPSPSMDKGAAYSLGMSGAVVCSSLFFSMLALLRSR